MRILLSIILSTALIAVPTLSFAHGDKIKTVKGIVSMALGAFENDEPGSIRNSFIGTKAWIDGTDLWVKVLLKDQAMVVYQCEIEKWEHQDGDDVPVGSCTKN